MLRWISVAFLICLSDLPAFAQTYNVKAIFQHDGANTARYEVSVDGGAPTPVVAQPLTPLGPDGQNLTFPLSLSPGVHIVTISACNTLVCVKSDPATGPGTNIPTPPAKILHFKIEITGTGTITVVPQ